ncbi:MAG: deoxyribonuclease IV [Gemmatimonadales bacterium]
MHQPSSTERLGAHVSVQGGVEKAPVRGKAIGATAIQVFTKTPSQWREPGVPSESYIAFQRECERYHLSSIVAHDSYLINLASPDPVLSARSEAAFMAELRRCEAFAIPYLVSHPGNYIDSRNAGVERNAAAYTRCLRGVPGSVVVLLETTAGCGTALGSTFEELALLRELVSEEVRHRIAFCADTCHLYSAGYDLVHDYDHVWDRWDEILGLDQLRCLHLNDSKTSFASCRDRHELIAEGSLGPQPFRRIMTDPRLDHVIKILETPKGDDQVAADRKMLRRLRRYARAARAMR